jgi:MFS family permease
MPLLMAMTTPELEQERRRGRLAGLAAIAAGILFPAGLVWAQVVNRDQPENDSAAQVRFFDRHSDQLVGAAALRSLALLLLVAVTIHLYRATKARKPGLNRIVLVTGVLGPVALAVGGLAHDIGLSVSAADFAERPSQTEEAADDVLQSPFQLTTLGLSVAGTLALAFWFVVGPLNAMRVGLLSRFMGVLGIIIGPTFLFPLPPLIITLWLLALGALFLRRWPSRLPPAWDTGDAVPWPSFERSAERPPEGDGSRNGEIEPVSPVVSADETRSNSGGETTAAGGRPRRRRKRRR